MTDDRPARRGRRVNRGRVERVEWITPHLVRVVIGGEGLAGFPVGAYTDHYVKILFPVPGVNYPEPFDMEAVHRDLPRDQWPRQRTYTVRSWDAEARELAIDFVYHGDHGLAGPWAAGVKPGEEVLFLGPGGGYAPSEKADWHLLVGDESALPAIAASLERLPEDATARVFVEVAGAEDEVPLASPGDARIVWLHRDTGEVGAALVEAVQNLEFPPGEVHAFVHGEAEFVKRLRRHLRIERGLSMDRLSISGYWRRGADDEGWRASKAEWNRRIEEEEATATA
ncbi:siderophore-interacting protein [Actinoallomurus sp. NPDC052274]|uniref:siderophore-interacting protein n=1 Tax=Actinoallomurus sp. NPDC052274 TaxID=3155420 RepID=UPI00342A1AFD